MRENENIADFNEGLFNQLIESLIDDINNGDHVAARRGLLSLFTENYNGKYCIDAGVYQGELLARHG